MERPEQADSAERHSQLWRAAYDLFDKAMDKPVRERNEFVHRESAGEPDLVPIVLQLLSNASAEECEMQQQQQQPPHEFQAGRRIGRYEITGKLGRGGMGHVFAARDTELDRMVALKFLNEAAGLLRGNPAERLVQEAKAVSALNHPNIVTIYDVVRENGDIALAMELVDGQALREFCSDVQPVKRVVTWGRQISQALAATHRCGIVHRDIKPENIMIRRDGAVKVLDFGLAKRSVVASSGGNAAILSSVGMLAGTLQYMSPEQTRGEAPTAASDIFSLGVILWELLLGRHPFLVDSPIDTAHAIAHAEPLPLPDGFPVALTELLREMLAKEPSLRPTAAEVESRLVSESGGRFQPQRQRPLNGRRGPWKHKWRVLSAVGFVMLAAALGWWSFGKAWLAPKAYTLVPFAEMPGRGVTAAAISPDGTMLAYAPVDGVISIRQLSGGATRALRSPKGLHATRIAWFADQKNLLVSGSEGEDEAAAIWLVGAEEGTKPREPVNVFSKGRDGVPSPDGKRLALASADGSLILVTNRDGSGQRTIRAGGTTTNFWSLVWSPDSKRVSYLMLRHTGVAPTTDPYQTFQTVDVETGAIVASVDGLSVYSGAALADGRIIGIPWAYPAHSHGSEVIEVRTDPKTGAFLGESRRKMPYAWDGLYSSFSASSDGASMTLVAATASVNLHVVTLERGAKGGGVVRLSTPQRLTYSLAEDYPHAWSADSRTVIYESNRAGYYHLYSAGLERGDETVLTPTEGTTAEVLAHLTPEGKWILFRSYTPGKGTTLLRMPPVAGGKAESVLAMGATPGEFKCGFGPGARCVIRNKEGDQYVYYELDPMRGQGRVLARTTVTPQLFYDWDLSPDGKTVASPNHDGKSAEIRLLSLDASEGGAQRTIALPGLRNLNAAAWDVGGPGLFVTASAASGGLVLYSDLQGRTNKLMHTAKATFVAPSPDGTKLVFPERVSSNSVQRLQLDQ